MNSYVKNKFFFSNSIIILKQLIFSAFLRNSAWLAVAQGFNGLTNLLLTIYLARTFGPTAFGQFAYALSYVMLFATFFDFGLTMAATREFSRDRTQEQYFLMLFLVKSTIGLITLSVIAVCSFTLVTDPLIRNMIFILGIYQLLFQSLNLFYAVFRARQRMEYEAFIRLFQAFGLIILSLIMIKYKHTVLSISIAYALTTFITLMVSVICVISSLGNALLKNKSTIDFSIARKFLLIGWYLALAQGVGDIMINTDSFLLGYWGMLKGVGLYNAANKINAAILFPMSIVSAAIFPILISALKDSQEKFSRYFYLWSKYTVMVSVMIVFFVIARPQEIIRLLYTDAYLQASSTLRILMIMTMILYVGNLYYQALLIFDQQRRMFYILCLGSVLNVILNLILIPRFGIEGSACATVLGQSITCIFYIIILSRHTFLNPLNIDFIKTLSLAIISGILMWICLSMLKIPLLFAVFVGMILYTILFYILMNGLKLVMNSRVSYAKR